MKNLLKKEFRFCLNPQTITFILLACTMAVPSFPTIVPFFYVLGGFAAIMPRALADKDIEYTVMLPVRKGDVVRGKVVLFSSLEVIALLISIPFAILRRSLWTPLEPVEGEAYESFLATIAMAPRIGSYAFALVAFGVYNLIFFPWYYKNPAKVNWPGIVSLLVTMLVLGLGVMVEVLCVLLGGGVDSLEFTLEGAGLYVQLGMVLFGAALFVGFTFLASKQAQKNFDKVDL
jgi:hypothetical protein